MKTAQHILKILGGIPYEDNQVVVTFAEWPCFNTNRKMMNELAICIIVRGMRYSQGGYEYLFTFKTTICERHIFNYENQLFNLIYVIAP